MRGLYARKLGLTPPNIVYVPEPVGMSYQPCYCLRLNVYLHGASVVELSYIVEDNLQ